jgi:hypothetical protein
MRTPAAGDKHSTVVETILVAHVVITIIMTITCKSSMVTVGLVSSTLSSAAWKWGSGRHVYQSA